MERKDRVNFMPAQLRTFSPSVPESRENVAVPWEAYCATTGEGVKKAGLPTAVQCLKRLRTCLRRVCCLRVILAMYVPSSVARYHLPLPLFSTPQHQVKGLW